MIETVEIKNYQPHKHTVLELSPGVNVIKGSSHGGKSSIWRAINWLLQNRPLGEGFRSHFSDEDTEIHVEFDNGVVSRIKGKKNIYQVNSGEDLEAIKSDIPTEVTNVTNINETNLQGQDDPYFLLLETPGKVARKLNKVVGLNIIDESLKKAQSIIRDTSWTKKVIKEEIETSKDKINKLKWLDDAKLLVDKIDQNLQVVSDVRMRLQNISRLINDTTELGKDINHINKWLEVKEPFDSLISKIVNWNEVKKDVDKLSNHINKVDILNHMLNELNGWMLIKEDSKALYSKVEKYKKESKKLWQLKSLCDSIDKLQTYVNSTNKNVSNLRIQYDKTLKSAGVCPLCKRPWNSNETHDHR